MLASNERAHALIGLRTSGRKVADIVDLGAEAAKQEKKIEAAKKSLASYEAKMKDPNYEQRVSGLFPHS